MRQIKVVESKQ